tara:strand:+ start:372 stop:578 length:207 start_codon:yes stop_codon:yes gene_type:complete
MLGTKEDVMELENNIDEYIFFQFQSSYADLLRDLQKVYGDRSHDVLMEYLELKNSEKVQEFYKSKLGV